MATVGSESAAQLKTGDTAKDSPVQQEENIFKSRILPFVKSKFGLDLSNYSTLRDISRLLKDLFELRKYLSVANLKLLLSKLSPIFRTHWRLLLPIVGTVVEFTLSRVIADEIARTLVLGKITLLIHILSVTLTFALAVVLLAQFCELFSINKQTNELIAQIESMDIKAKLKSISERIERLEIIADQVERLIEKYEAGEEADIGQLGEEILTKIEDANEHEYAPVCKEIQELQYTIETQRQALSNFKLAIDITDTVSLFGAIGAIAVGCTVPMVGIVGWVGLTAFGVAGVGGFVGGFACNVVRDKLAEQLQVVHKHLKTLDRSKCELECVMARLKKQQDWTQSITKLDFDL